MGDIARVGVVGCGQMGAGIAEVCARCGLEVMVAETTGEALEIGRTRLYNSLPKARRARQDDREERTRRRRASASPRTSASSPTVIW
ncbi:hypothetical protein STENM223S_04833 [Streptomyces tendae]